jgi:hypothetical protein
MPQQEPALSALSDAEQLARFRRVLTDSVIHIWSVPWEIRQSWLDDIHIRNEMGEKLSPLEVLVGIVLAGAQAGEATVRAMEQHERGKAAGPPTQR